MDVFTNIEQEGTEVFVSHNLHASPLELEASHLFSESVRALIKLDHGNTLQIGCIYGSHSSSNSNNNNLMRLILEASNSQDTHKLIIGAFNFPE